jgi:hypothetical protein
MPLSRSGKEQQMSDIIRDLELSVRATNVLTRYGRVKTLEDFLALDRQTVMGLPKSGARTWEEIERMQLYLLREEKVNAPPPKWGGPAFPIPKTETHDTWPGMSLRDAAALAALQGILANSNDSYGPENMRYAAGYAWQAADAFIAAREGKTE